MSNSFKLIRQVNKTINRPPSPTWIFQADFDLDFYAYPRSGEVVFHVPRRSAVNQGMNKNNGDVIDLGLDWSESELNIKNSIIPRTFFDELAGATEEFPDKYFNFLKRDYYIESHRGERWNVSLNHDWALNYLATITGQPAKKLSGTVIAPPNLTRSRYMYFQNKIWRIWDSSNNIYLSDEYGWANPQLIGVGKNPSVAATSDGVIYAAWENSGKIVYRTNDGTIWSNQKTVNELHPVFPIASPTIESGATYREPFIITHGETVWIFYIKNNGSDSFNYAVASQDFKFEHFVPSLGGEKYDLFVYPTDDNRLMLTWINKFNSVTNVFCMFASVMRAGFFGKANVGNQVNSMDSCLLPKDTFGLTLISATTGEELSISYV